MFNPLFGPVLATLRAARHLNCRDAAMRAGCSAGTISRLESSQRLPSLTLLENLADAYSVPVWRIVRAAEDLGLNPDIDPMDLRRLVGEDVLQEEENPE